MGILRPATDFRYQTALYQRRKTRSGSAWRKPDSLGYPGCCKSAPGTCGQCAKDGLVPFVLCRRVTAYGGERHSKMCSDLFKQWSVQSAIMASGGHSLDATTPMLDQPQFLKYSADDAVAEFGNSFLDIFNSEAEGEQAGVFNLQAIVK